MNWYISIYIQDFPAQAYAAYHPEIVGMPYVMARQRADSHKSVVTSLSPEAQARGIYHGFSVARLKERFGDVRIVQEDPSLAAAIAGDLGAVLAAFSPDVRVDKRGNALVNVSGMQRLLAARPRRRTWCLWPPAQPRPTALSYANRAPRRPCSRRSRQRPCPAFPMA